MIRNGIRRSVYPGDAYGPGTRNAPRYDLINALRQANPQSRESTGRIVQVPGGSDPVFQAFNVIPINAASIVPFDCDDATEFCMERIGSMSDGSAPTNQIKFRLTLQGRTVCDWQNSAIQSAVNALPAFSMIRAVYKLPFDHVDICNVHPTLGCNFAFIYATGDAHIVQIGATT